MRGVFGSVLLSENNDGGELIITHKNLELSGGLLTAAYFSLFGGNDEDDGRGNSTKTWWGNLVEENPSSRMLSRTQHLLKSLPFTTSNLQRLKDAAQKDLEWMIKDKVASSVEVSISIPCVDHVHFNISIYAEGKVHNFTFSANWKAEAA